MKSIEGFAEKSSHAIIESIQKKKKVIENLLALGLEFIVDEINTGEGSLKDLKFCITGELSLPRSDIEKMIKKNGGIVVSSVSKNTSYLVTNEIESTSSKFIKAKTLGVPIKTEKDLLSMLGVLNGKN